METDLKADFDRAAAKPGFFDVQGKQKWAAWKELGDANPERAMQVSFSPVVHVFDLPKENNILSS